MGIDDEVLILGPFKEVIERGKEAVANAGGAGDEDVEHSKLMLKAAQGVVREGERALKRLQPLWDSQVEKYGEAFKTGVSQNGIFLPPFYLVSEVPNYILTHHGRGYRGQEKEAGGHPLRL